MTLASATASLLSRLKEFQESVDGLRTTVREDTPLEEDVVLVDLIGDQADELAGRLKEVRISLGEPKRQPPDPAGAFRALNRCQEAWLEAERQYWDLVSHERIAPLGRFGRKKGGEWLAWTKSVERTLEGCRQPFWQVKKELLNCCRELADRIAARTSVRVTSVGANFQLCGREESGRGKT